MPTIGRPAMRPSVLSEHRPLFMNLSPGRLHISKMWAVPDHQNGTLNVHRHPICSFKTDPSDSKRIFVSRRGSCLMHVLGLSVRGKHLIADDAAQSVLSRIPVQMSEGRHLACDGVNRILCYTANRTIIYQPDKDASPSGVRVTDVELGQIQSRIHGTYGCRVPVATSCGLNSFQFQLPVEPLLYRPRFTPTTSLDCVLPRSSPATPSPRMTPVKASPRGLVVHGPGGVLFWQRRDPGTGKFHVTSEQAAFLYAVWRHRTCGKPTGLTREILRSLVVVAPEYPQWLFSITLRGEYVAGWPFGIPLLRLKRLGPAVDVPPPETAYASMLLQRGGGVFVVCADARWQKLCFLRIWVVPLRRVLCHQDLWSIVPVAKSMAAFPYPFVSVDILESNSRVYCFNCGIRYVNT